jgi:hypothetical protein
MPIRKDLLPLYKTPEYRAARERIQARAGDKCEQCGKPNGARVETKTGTFLAMLGAGRGHYMFWRDAGPWRDWRGELAAVYGITGRMVRVVLTLAHLDHNPANNSDDNLKFLCQWCHLNYDKLHHAETRSIRKDRERPLLTQ